MVGNARSWERDNRDGELMCEYINALTTWRGRHGVAKVQKSIPNYAGRPICAAVRVCHSNVNGKRDEFEEKNEYRRLSSTMGSDLHQSPLITASACHREHGLAHSSRTKWHAYS